MAELPHKFVTTNGIYPSFSNGLQPLRPCWGGTGFEASPLLAPRTDLHWAPAGHRLTGSGFLLGYARSGCVSVEGTRAIFVVDLLIFETPSRARLKSLPRLEIHIALLRP
jgi:hypothetical protein